MSPTPAGGLHPPISQLLHWPKPDYNNPPLRHGAVPVVVIFTVLALCMIAARIFVRGVMQRNMGLDDWLVLLAMIPTLGLSIGTCLLTSVLHLDRHAWDTHISEFVDQRKAVWAIELCYVLATTLIKVSILLFYRRLKGATLSSRYLWVVSISMAFVVAYGFECFFVLIFSCSPISDFWNQVEPKRIFKGNPTNCIDEGSSLVANTGISVLLDLVAALVPTYLFWTLPLDKKHKYALSAVFALAYLTCIVGILRLVFIYKVFYQNYDVTWYTYEVWILNSIETLMGATCASAPPLKVFFRRLRRSQRGSTFFRYDPWGYNDNSLTSQEDDGADNSPPREDLFQRHIAFVPRNFLFKRNYSTTTSSQTRVSSHGSVPDDFGDQGKKTPKTSNALELAERVAHRVDEVVLDEVDTSIFDDGSIGYRLSLFWRPSTPGLKVPIPEV